MRARPYIAAEVDPVTAEKPPERNPNRALRSVIEVRSLFKENNMDAKYNWLIDNAAIRVTLNTVAFALWAVLAVGLLELASKV